MMPCKGTNCGTTDPRFHSRECYAQHDACYTDPAEPVAWMSPGGDVSRSLKYFEGMGCSNCVPLYADPPAQPTTEPVGWIPCSERMPPYRQFVLVARPSVYSATPWEFSTARLYNNYGEGLWFDSNNDHLTCDGALEPIYWMPLPAAPSTEGEAK